MKVKAHFSIEDAEKRLYAVLAPEIEDYNKRQRSNVSVKQTSHGVEISVDADDPVALKATINSLLQLVIVYGKLEKK